MINNYVFPEEAPSPLPLRSQAEVIASWKYDAPPLVSILCATYNHVDFIEDAIRGFLGQVTTFPFEVIIRDDASTDGTGDLVRRFAQSHPKIIKPIFENANTFCSKKPFPHMLAASCGEFIALCEGDDYWIDDKKLESQVQILRQDPKISLVRTQCLNVEGNRVIGLNHSGGTRTYMLRRFEDYPVHRQKYLYFGDAFITSCLASEGRFFDLPNVTAVWRKHAGGVWSSLINTDVTLLQFRRATTQFWLSEYFLGKGESDRACTHLVISINKMIVAYPELEHAVKVKLIFHWITPTWPRRALKFLARKLRFRV